MPAASEILFPTPEIPRGGILAEIIKEKPNKKQNPQNNKKKNLEKQI